MPSAPASLTVIFDGDCGVCQRLAQFAADRDPARRLRFTAYQRADLAALSPGLTREMTARSVYVVEPDGTRWRGARAVFEIMRRMPGLWAWIGRAGALPPVSLLAEPFYRLAARHRTRISRWLGLTQCRLDTSHRP
ncbi:MAG TPA: DUF393 domain-containing protein [Aggregatilineaceae bacterium]|nr:DUF393 domain-containing protein [Anaerolineae bacterium]HMM27056.1 DUF393 domain-containing protein [Aggregatilineaceae bacterium]